MRTHSSRLSREALIDRELRCHGTSARAWARNYGLTDVMFGEIINRPSERNQALLAELAERLGVSIESLTAW